jgi:hypothetical protein
MHNITVSQFYLNITDFRRSQLSNLEITQHVRALAAIARGCAVNDETSSASFKSVVSDQIKLEGIILNLFMNKENFH